MLRNKKTYRGKEEEDSDEKKAFMAIQMYVYIKACLSRDKLLVTL